MADLFPYKLKLWENPALALQAIFGRPESDTVESRLPHLQGPHNPRDFAQKLFSLESLQPAQLRLPPQNPPEPYSLQWFLDIENQRHSKHGKWIPKLLEFAKHSGEKLLGVGHGLGTDWVQYARCGAAVVACGPAADHLALAQRNFELRGLRGQFLPADPAALPVETASVDVACVAGLLHVAPDPAAVVAEVYRVLKPGGKVLAVAPARYDAAYWSRFVSPWRRWFSRRTPPAGPAAGFSRRRLRRLFARFTEPRVHKRCLRRSDTPHLWRWLPLPVLERLIGRFLILKAFKPLTAAMSVQRAA